MKTEKEKESMNEWMNERNKISIWIHFWTKEENKNKLKSKYLHKLM